MAEFILIVSFFAIMIMVAKNLPAVFTATAAAKTAEANASARKAYGPKIVEWTLDARGNSEGGGSTRLEGLVRHQQWSDIVVTTSTGRVVTFRGPEAEQLRQGLEELQSLAKEE